MPHNILVVDDEKDILDSLERQFRKDYRVLKASSGIDALRILQKEAVQIILSDQRMPEMTGVQLFERAQKIQPDAIRILLTGYTDVASVIAAINSGQIYRYITKPWDPTEMDIVVKRALETYDLRSELRVKNESLEKALAELKTLDQAKSHFMILIGHELKTPLTTISSFLDLLSEEKLSEEAKKYVLRISQGVGRLRDVVFDVLDILNAETGQMPLSQGAHRLFDIVQNIEKEVGIEAEKRKLKIELPDKKLTALFDSQIISKVLKKLIHNAVKFANHQTTVSVKGVSQGDEVLITVENHGPMISKERISHILKPFNLDEDIMHHTQGMGLGLSVCQSLLRHHGSSLTIDSNEEVTRVGFLLPAP